MTEPKRLVPYTAYCASCRGHIAQISHLKLEVDRLRRALDACRAYAVLRLSDDPDDGLARIVSLIALRSLATAASEAAEAAEKEKR